MTTLRLAALSLLLATFVSAGANAQARDTPEWYQNHTASCVKQVEVTKQRADFVKADLKDPKLKGMKESTENAQLYAESLAKYNRMKANNYPDTGTRIAGYSQNKDNDACGALDGFRNYETNMSIDNDAVYRAKQAADSAGTLSDAQKAIKTKLEACVERLKVLQTNNNSDNERSKKIFNTTNPQLTKWSGVNDKINTFLKSNFVTYTDDNLKACEALAADKSVSEEYNKLSAQKSGQNVRDAAAEKKEADEKAAAQAKKDLDAQNAIKAAADKATADRAAAAAAKADAEAKAAAASTIAISINTATYGSNCPKNADVAAKVKSACNGKSKCSYTVSVGVLGDPAPGCAKTFVATYTCTSKPNTRTVNLAAEANNKVAEFDCTK